MSDYKLAVFIGRFQPLHNAHLQTIKKSLRQADHLLLIIGSYHAAPNIKNPFSFNEREIMVRKSLSEQENRRVTIAGVRDYYYSDHIWVANIQSMVSEFEVDDDEICLIASYKDASSYYLDLFPQWHKEIARVDAGSADATEIRQIMFNQMCGTEDFRPYVPAPVHDWLCENFIGDERHAQLIREASFIESYQRSWAEVPYPVTFVTVDAVVIRSGHVLLVKRKMEPGKGLLALPGGFIKQNERLHDAVIRELKEETRIEIPAVELRKYLRDSHVFDHPGRSLRGRTITHAYLLDLGSGELPRVKGEDDAESARWLPLSALRENEQQIYEDHIHIIERFISRKG